MSSNYKNKFSDVWRVLKAIREYQRTREIVLIACHKQYQTKALLYIEKGNKTVQSETAGLETVLTAVEKWNKKFKEFIWRNAFAKCHKCTCYRKAGLPEGLDDNSHAIHTTQEHTHTHSTGA